MPLIVFYLSLTCLLNAFIIMLMHDKPSWSVVIAYIDKKN